MAAAVELPLSAHAQPDFRLRHLSDFNLGLGSLWRKVGATAGAPCGNINLFRTTGPVLTGNKSSLSLEHWKVLNG